MVQILRDLHPDPSGRVRVYSSASSWKVVLDWGNPLAPWEALFILRDIVGAPEFGRDEKLAWECALTFRGVPLTVAFQKFGLRAYIENAAMGQDKAEELARTMVDTLANAVPLLRKTVLAEIADGQVANGLVNVENHYNRLRDQLAARRYLTDTSLAKLDPTRDTNTRTVTELPPGD